MASAEWRASLDFSGLAVALADSWLLLAESWGLITTRSSSPELVKQFPINLTTLQISEWHTRHRLV